MNVLINPADMMKSGLLSVGLIADANSQTYPSGELQNNTYTLVNKLTVTLEQLAAIGVPAVPVAEINKPGQVIDLFKFVDEEEESWLQLLSRSRKKLAAEGEL